MAGHIVPGGRRAVFDEGVRQGADFVAIVEWANYNHASVVYITAPYTTDDLIAEDSPEGGVECIYDLRRDRDYQILSPYRQWNTEAGPSEPEREYVEGYFEEFPEFSRYLTRRHGLHLPAPSPLPHPHGPAVEPTDPVTALRASVHWIHEAEVSSLHSTETTHREARQNLLRLSFPSSSADAILGETTISQTGVASAQRGSTHKASPTEQAR